MIDEFKEIFLDSVKVKRQIVEKLLPEIEKITEIIIESLENGGKILICGNGGSSSDSQHFAGELICTFEERKRKSLPAIALTTNNAVITAYANDFDYGGVFKRQIEGLGNSKDVLICLTTSGNSVNIINALETAKKIGMKTICLNGGDGGKIGLMKLDSNFVVPSEKTPRIQEAHITIIHAICKIIDERMFKK